MAVIGDKASKAAALAVAPVPPLAIPTVPKLIVFVARESGVLKVRAFSLLLNVVQLADERRPLEDPEAVGRLKVWAVPDEEILKSVPLVPVANVWVAPVKPFIEVIPDDGIPHDVVVPLVVRNLPELAV